MKNFTSKLSLFLGAALSCTLTCSANADTKPNVILILADDLGIGGLNCTGNPLLETPHIDKMADQGIKFSKGLSPYPTCKPSRAAILSGQYGPRTGVYRVSNKHIGEESKIKYNVPENSVLPLESTTIAEAFKSAGYKTAMFGKWHASNDSDGHPKYHGFDEAISSTGHQKAIKTVPEIEIPKGSFAADVMTQKAERFIDASHKEAKPFFLFMPYYLVHKPLEARPDYIAHFKEKYASAKLTGKHPDDAHVLAAMTKMLDDCVGQISQKLEELKIAENTIIIFTSDNGAYDENFTNKLTGTKGLTYEGGLRVPYIFQWKGKIPSGITCDERITGVDLYPSLLKLANITPPQDHILDGADISPLLLNKAADFIAKDIFCYYPKYAKISKKTKRWIDSWRNVIYSGDLKLIEYPEYNEYELFDLNNDPFEKTNLASKHPEKLETLKNKLHTWLIEIDAPKLELNKDYQGIQ